jgi:hypothetical protein
MTVLQGDPSNRMIEMCESPAITASKFKEGDQVRFNGALHFTVIHVDAKFAYLRALFEATSEYRVSLRSSELRWFDQMGWTLLEGFFDQHTPATKAIQ